MKAKSIALALLAILFITLTWGCTANQMAKQYGGTMTINLPAGEKLTNASWKNDDLWYLTRPMRPGETPETSTLREDSSFGMLKGTVIFIERAR